MFTQRRQSKKARLDVVWKWMVEVPAFAGSDEMAVIVKPITRSSTRERCEGTRKTAAEQNVGVDVLRTYH